MISFNSRSIRLENRGSCNSSTLTTVVIPFWDLDLGILQQSIDSVRAQSEPCEIIVVDNRSAVPVAPQPNVRVLRLRDRVSVGQARNIALTSVRTPYVMFLDADDVLLPDAVASLRSLLERTPGASLAAGAILDWVAQTGFRRRKPWPSDLAYRLSRFGRLFALCNLVRNMTPVTGCAVMHTDKALKTSGFPDTTAEDWTFGVSMSFQGPVVLTRQVVKLYRWRPDSLSKLAVWNLRDLYAARKATRSAAMKDPCVPTWIKWLAPLLFVMHTLELPFHIRRERRFGDLGAPCLGAASALHWASQDRPANGPMRSS